MLVTQFNMSYDLLPYCEGYHCSYAAIASTDISAEFIAHILRFNFIKVYALHEISKEIPKLRERFSDNNRIQIFHNAHAESFFEMSRMVPTGYPAVFILKADETHLLDWLSNIAFHRPKKSDVILATNRNTNDSAIFNRISTLYGYTHEVGMAGDSITIIPMVKFKTTGFGSYVNGRA